MSDIVVFPDATVQSLSDRVSISLLGLCATTLDAESLRMLDRKNRGIAPQGWPTSGIVRFTLNLRPLTGVGTKPRWCSKTRNIFHVSVKLLSDEDKWLLSLCERLLPERHVLSFVMYVWFVGVVPGLDTYIASCIATNIDDDETYWLEYIMKVNGRFKDKRVKYHKKKDWPSCAKELVFML